ncbi:MAG TPA: J domain-containing protein [Verrucomicrobiae bacterium]|nr:J domain-containing protein [Verrucomicrobiae bacterium]
MPDYFTLFGEARRPWLDPDRLKQKFLSLSTTLHPDKAPDEATRTAAAQRFAELNSAYRCLAEPKSRLLHLLELERGARPAEIQQIPADLAGLFADVATTCRQADQFLVEKGKITSPLRQVQLFEQAHEWIDRLNVLREKLTALHQKLSQQLKSIDAEWPTADAAARSGQLAAIEELYRLFGYLSRWSAQIQDRIVRLTL